MKKNIFLFFILFITLSYSQNRKEVEITRFNSPPVIDGDLNDSQWKNLIPATEFERWMPNNGQSERLGYETSFIWVTIIVEFMLLDNSMTLIHHKFPLDLVKETIYGEVNADSFWLKYKYK